MMEDFMRMKGITIGLISFLLFILMIGLSFRGSGHYGITSTPDKETYLAGEIVSIDITTTEESTAGIEIQNPNGSMILYDVLTTKNATDNEGNITFSCTFTFRIPNGSEAGFYSYYVTSLSKDSTGKAFLTDRFIVKSPLIPLDDPENDWHPMVPVPLVLGAVALSGAFSVAWLSDRGRFLLLSVVFLPLYTRMKKNIEDDLLEHSNRGRIFQMIKDSPGVTLKGIKQAVETGNGTTVYHLKTLERNGQIMKEGIHYYIKGSKPQIYHGLRRHLRPREKSIVNVLFEMKSADEKTICAEIMESQSNVNRDLKQLISHTIVKRNKFGGPYYYSLTADYLQWIEESLSVDYHEINRTCSACNQLIPMKSALYCPKCGMKI